MQRRKFLQAAISAPLVPGVALAADTKETNRIGVTDWTIGARAELKAFDFAKEIGLGCVQVSYNPEATGDQYDLAGEKSQEAVLARSEELESRLHLRQWEFSTNGPSSLTPRRWNGQSVGLRSRVRSGKTSCSLLFFGKNDLKDDKEGTAETIKRLNLVSPVAEEHGISLGLETTIDADEHLHIIESVGSDAVKVYYDLGNSHGNGYDIDAEIRKLGKDLICEVHCKDKDGGIFGKGKLISFLPQKH